MKQRTIAFQMEPLSEVNPERSNSLYLMHKAQQLGHVCYQYHPRELTLSNERVFARARRVQVNYNAKPFYRLGDDELVDLSGVDVVMIRQNPPVNMEYITATYMLEPLTSRTLVVNHPVSVRNAPEKIFPLLLGDFAPDTIVTEDYHAAEAFMHSHGRAIVKPLYLFGGQDVFLFSNGDEKKFAAKWQELLKVHQAPLVVQQFIPEVEEGDTRILLVDGEVKGAFRRVPEKGSVRANLMAGGTLHKTILTPRQLAICEALSPILKQHRFYICGIDIIGDYLTEVNITSPMGFKQIDDMYGANTGTEFWEMIEGKLE